MKISMFLLAIVVVIEFFGLIGMDGYADHFSLSIESTELAHNPWPAPGDQPDVASGRSRSPSSASVPANNSETGVTTR